jgi:predicted ester cyclase
MNLLPDVPQWKLRLKRRPFLFAVASALLFRGSRKATAQSDSPDLQEGDGARYFREFWNGDPQLALRRIDPEARMYGGDGRIRASGPEEFLGIRGTYMRAFSDLNVEIDEVFTLGDTTIVRWTARGVHTGALRGIEGTRRKVTFRGAHFLRTRDRRIVEERYFYDSLDLYEQLGAVRLPSL